MIIRKITFDNEKLGTYSFSQIQNSWRETLSSVGVSEGRCKIIKDKDLNKKVLQVSYVKSKTGPKDGGAAWRMKLGRSYDELYIQFKVKFPIGFNFVLGGKLPGVGGGSLPVGGEKSDERGFTARIMWRGEDDGKKGRIVQYVYYMDKDQDKKCGEDLLWKDGKSDIYFKLGKWHNIKTRVRMNKPNKKDGIIQSWLDNKLVLNRKIKFRNEDKLGVDTVIFTTFFGGSTKEWAPKKNERILFDEFIIFTQE